MPEGPLNLLTALQQCLHSAPGAATNSYAAIGDGVVDVAAEHLEVASLTPAAVLVPLITHVHGTSVLLTQRTAHLEKHAGQVSFPGGHVEAHDSNHVDTALRETEEETGLQRTLVTIAGSLDECRTGTGYRITPIVGLIRPGFELAPDSYEVAEIFEAPLSHILDAANHKRCYLVRDGKRRYFYEIHYQDHRIWGATAAMLVNLGTKLEKAGYLNWFTK